MRGGRQLEVLLCGVAAALLVLCLYVAWGLPPAAGVGGEPHPDYPSMWVGGSGLERHGGLLTVGWLFGALTILVFVLLIAFGGRRRGRLGSLSGPLIVGLAAYLAVFTWMMAAYGDSLVDPEESELLFLGFPRPTAIMLYVFYPVSTLFNVYFVAGFRRWVLTEEDEARYDQLVESHRRRRERELGHGEAG